MTASQKRIAAKLAAIRSDLAKRSTMTAPDVSAAVSALDAIIAKCGGVASAAGNAAAKLAALAVTGSAQFAHGTGGGAAMGALATGPKTGYNFTLHGTELILPTDNPSRAQKLLTQHWAKLGIGGVGTSNSGAPDGGRGSTTGGDRKVIVQVVVPGGTTIVGTARQVATILAPHVAHALDKAEARHGRGS